MRRILLTPIYPIWFFFAKTYIGQVCMIPICTCHLLILGSLIFPDYMNNSKHEGFAEALLLISLLLCIPSAALFMKLSWELEIQYEKLNYRTRELSFIW